MLLVEFLTPSWPRRANTATGSIKQCYFIKTWLSSQVHVFWEKKKPKTLFSSNPQGRGLITRPHLIYLWVKQGCGCGFWQCRDFWCTQIEWFIQVKQGANHTGSQTAHLGNGVGLEVARQLNINPVVSVRRGEKENIHVSGSHNVAINQQSEQSTIFPVAFPVLTVTNQFSKKLGACTTTKGSSLARWFIFGWEE